MKLTTQTDYALRVLMQVGLSEGGLVRIADVARGFDISHNHLMKVVHRLGMLGYLETVQGRGGGLRLAREPESITVGEVVRDFETDTVLVECFDRTTSRCRIQGACVLQRALGHALRAFLETLDSVKLSDLLEPRRKLRRVLAVSGPGRASMSKAARGPC